MHFTAVLCSFRQCPKLRLQLTQWTDGLNVGIFLLWRSWSLVYKEKAEDPIFEFCSFNFVVVVNIWFASILPYLFFCILMVFILPRVILLLSNRKLVMYYAVWSKLLVIQGFSMHCGTFLHQGTHSVEWKTLVAHIIWSVSSVCVQLCAFVCTQEWLFACLGVYASVLNL